MTKKKELSAIEQALLRTGKFECFLKTEKDIRRSKIIKEDICPDGITFGCVVVYASVSSFCENKPERFTRFPDATDVINGYFIKTRQGVGIVLGFYEQVAGCHCLDTCACSGRREFSFVKIGERIGCRCEKFLESVHFPGDINYCLKKAEEKFLK